MNYFGFPLTNKFRSKVPRGFYDPVKHHTGIDVVMPVGTPLALPINGVVLKYRNQAQMGNCLYIQEKNGNIHVLAHLSKSEVKEGQPIMPNQVLAYSGNTGTATTAPHVHYEIMAALPQKGLEVMTRELKPYKGWNIDPEEFLAKASHQEHWSDASMDWLVDHKIISFARNHSEPVTWGEFAVTLNNLALKLVEWSKKDSKDPTI